MFFNYCCKRPCCRCEKNNKNEKNYCDIKDKYDYDKCGKKENYENEKKERCCCHVNFEKKCCWDKDEDKSFERNDHNYHHNDRSFDDKSYYGEYNNLGSFGYSDKEYYYEQDGRKSYDKEDNRKSYNNENNRKDDDRKSYDDDNGFDYKKCYTPNWENDRDCKCDKDNKHDKDNRCCKPVKYICFPWDKY